MLAVVQRLGTTSAVGQIEGLALVEQTKPDLVVVDISLKTGNGIDLIKDIKARHPTVKMLVVSGYDESLYAERSLRAGAMGYLNKQETNERVIEAIRTVLAGKRYLSLEMTQRLVGRAVGAADAMASSPVATLSNREVQVFRLIGQGESTGNIASQLHLSVHTVESYRQNIKQKLGIHNASELQRHAFQWVLENP